MHALAKIGSSYSSYQSQGTTRFPKRPRRMRRPAISRRTLRHSDPPAMSVFNVEMEKPERSGVPIFGKDEFERVINSLIAEFRSHWPGVTNWGQKLIQEVQRGRVPTQAVLVPSGEFLDTQVIFLGPEEKILIFEIYFHHIQCEWESGVTKSSYDYGIEKDIAEFLDRKRALWPLSLNVQFLVHESPNESQDVRQLVIDCKSLSNAFAENGLPDLAFNPKALGQGLLSSRTQSQPAQTFRELVSIQRWGDVVFTLRLPRMPREASGEILWRAWPNEPHLLVGQLPAGFPLEQDPPPLRLTIAHHASYQPPRPQKIPWFQATEAQRMLRLRQKMKKALESLYSY